MLGLVGKDVQHKLFKNRHILSRMFLPERLTQLGAN